jgi:exosortase A
MPPELAARSDRPSWRDIASPWAGSLVAVSAVWLALIAAFHGTWGEMAAQWWSSSTYSHILLVPAILAWLVHVRAKQLARLTPRAWWPGLLPFALSLLLWLIGSVSGLSIAAHAGAVAMLAASAIVLLGPKVSAALTFPIAYMAFLIPFGDELVPTMQMVTAKLTVALVGLTGIPAAVDGVFIDTPAGLFEVAEACSGVKFLIAMAAFGVLVANVCFRSLSRRAAFLFLALALPILANGLRAWGTIFVAQYVGAERATGFDHIVYGWIFFALVIVAVLAMSWRFFDRRPDDPMIDAEAIERAPLFSRFEALWVPKGAAVGLLALFVLGVATWANAATGLSAPPPRRLVAPSVSGWSVVDYRPRAPWTPRASGADATMLARYRSAAGAEVDVFMAYYSTQDEGREAGSFGQGAIPPDGGWSWLSLGPAMPEAKVDRLFGPGRVERLTATTFRIGNLVTGSNLRLKLTTVGDRLRLKARPTLVLILSSERHEGRDAAEDLRAFRASVGSLGAWMDRTAGLR